MRWAIDLLSASIARRKSAQAWKAAIAKAKEMFLDTEAMAAGAEDSPLYSASALHIRGSLKHTEEVQAALSDVWAGLIPEGCKMMTRTDCERSRPCPAPSERLNASAFLARALPARRCILSPRSSGYGGAGSSRRRRIF